MNKTKRSLRKSIHLKRRRGVTQKKRGGGDLTDACKKYRHQGVRPSIPDPIAIQLIPQTQFNLLKGALETVPLDSILLLKVGANDSSSAVDVGSKGKGGTFFVEVPIEASGVTSLKVLPNLDIVKRILNYVEIGNENNNTTSDTKVYSLSIDPSSPSQYPFDDTSPNAMTSDFSKINAAIDKRMNLNAYFPIGDSEGTDRTILNMIVNHPKPLILFNAMGSYCYRSFKYILDNRKLQGRKSVYMGLVDAPQMASCDINDILYPNPTETCSQHNKNLRAAINAEERRIAELRASDPNAAALINIDKFIKNYYESLSRVGKQRVNAARRYLEQGKIKPSQALKAMKEAQHF